MLQCPRKAFGFYLNVFVLIPFVFISFMGFTKMSRSFIIIVTKQIQKWNKIGICKLICEFLQIQIVNLLIVVT